MKMSRSSSPKPGRLFSFASSASSSSDGLGMCVDDGGRNEWLGPEWRNVGNVEHPHEVAHSREVAHFVSQIPYAVPASDVVHPHILRGERCRVQDERPVRVPGPVVRALLGVYGDAYLG